MATAASRLTASATHSPSVVITLRRQYGPGHRHGPGSPVWSRGHAFLSWRFLRGCFSRSRRSRLFVAVVPSSRQVAARLKSALGGCGTWSGSDSVSSSSTRGPLGRGGCRSGGSHASNRAGRGTPVPRGIYCRWCIVTSFRLFFSAVFVFAQSGFGLGSPLPSMVLP